MRNGMPVSEPHADWQVISPYHRAAPVPTQCLQQIKPSMKINYPT